MHWTAYTSLIVGLLAQATSASYLEQHNIPVVKTVTLPNGQVIDWIRKESQGNVARPPPFLPPGNYTTVNVKIFEDHHLGPEGTVPVVRSQGTPLPMKASPSARSSRIQSRQNHGKH